MQKIKNIVAVMLLLVSASAYTVAAANGPEKLETIEIKVKGITCAMEPGNISKEVKKLDGVESCELKGKAKAKSTFVISYNPSKVTKKEIYKAVEACYSCDRPKEQPYTVIN